uniref:Uncharacterized protein AlNc14C121G6682 n=1 Tax=Albugo laibachii Nc14 TaxID=890382 RepID=F0WJF3_9STRA|nr:conserved hypothetical protein [Albugo laibachii Nc14]|eukprot:CCA21402.1 conserved hypothetical protein [Albugo laibachii Nc14]
MQLAEHDGQEEPDRTDQSDITVDNLIPPLLLSASVEQENDRISCSSAFILNDPMDPFASLAAPVIQKFECDSDRTINENLSNSSELARLDTHTDDETAAASVLFSPLDKTDDDPFSATPKSLVGGLIPSSDLSEVFKDNSVSSSDISEVFGDSLNPSPLLFTASTTNAFEDPFRKLKQGQELASKCTTSDRNLFDVSDMHEKTENERSLITQISESILELPSISALQKNISPLFSVKKNTGTRADPSNESITRSDVFPSQMPEATFSKIHTNSSSGFSPASVPFLNYSDDNRSQSFQSIAAASPATSITEKRDNVKRDSMTSPANKLLSKKPIATTPPAPPSTTLMSSLSRAQIEVRSVDELMENFWNASPDDNLSYFGISRPDSSNRPVKLSINDLPDEPSSLELLCRQGRCKSLIRKAKCVIQDERESEQILELKSWYLAALIKEGFYDEAETVLHQLGDLREVQRFVSSTHSRSSTENECINSHLIMRLRSLEATLYKYKEDALGYEKKLCMLIMEITKAIEEKKTHQVFGVDEDKAELWLQVTQFTLIHHTMQEQRFALALRLCSTLRIERIKMAPDQIAVLSRIGRIYMQLGDIESAEMVFQHVRHLSEKLPSHQNQTLHAQVLMNKGLLLLSRDNVQEAIEIFSSILHLELANGQTKNSQWSNEIVLDDLLLEQEDLICAAVNNYAICALYSCDVHGAVAMLEKMIRLSPVRFLNEVVVFNLSSLYDLIYDNANSTNRKEMLKRIADAYDLEHIDAAAFRI